MGGSFRDQRAKQTGPTHQAAAPVEDGVEVVGRGRRRDIALDAVQVNHLAADECPPGRVTFGQVEEPAPGLAYPRLIGASTTLM
ncbi:MAG: hypothetical protein ACOH17_10590 [Cellulomonas sp.]